MSSEFPGELGRRIRWTGPPMQEGALGAEASSMGGRDADARRKAAKMMQRAMFQKLELLKERYGIGKHDIHTEMQLLLFSVCNEFIPGFQIDYASKRRGAPQKWDEARYARLVYDADIERAKGAKSDQKACEILIRSAIKVPRGIYLPVHKRGIYLPVHKKNEKISTIGESIASLAARLSEARKMRRNQIAAIFGGSLEVKDRQSIIEEHRKRRPARRP